MNVCLFDKIQSDPLFEQASDIVTGLEELMESIQSIGDKVVGYNAIFAQHATCASMLRIATRNNVSHGFEADEVDISNIPDDVEVTLESVADKLKMGVKALAATIQRLFEKIVAFFKDITAKYRDFSKSINEVTESLLPKLSNANYTWKQSEWRVPNADSLQVEGMADLTTIGAGIRNFAENYTAAFRLLSEIDSTVDYKGDDSTWTISGKHLRIPKKVLGVGNYYLKHGETLDHFNLLIPMKEHFDLDVSTATYASEPPPSSIKDVVIGTQGLLALEKLLNKASVDLKRRKGVVERVVNSATFGTKTSGIDKENVSGRRNKQINQMLSGFGAYRWIGILNRLYGELLTLLRSIDSQYVKSN